MKSETFLNILYLLLFLIAVSLSILGLIFESTSNSVNTEWRNLTKFPQLNSRISLYEFPRKFEEYFNDNFGLRNWMLQRYEEIKVNIFQTAPSRFDIQGKQNWSFYNPLSFDPYNPNYKAIYERVEFSNFELESINKKFTKERDWLKERNINYILVIVPDKEVIYPEFYPYPNNIITNIGLDQLQNYLQKNGNLNVLYLKEALLKAKKIYNTPLYYHYDTHWNKLGSFIGYKEIMKKFMENHPDVQILTDSDFEFKTEILTNFTGDLVRLIPGIKKQGEIEVDFLPKDTSTNKIMKKGNIYLYGDSYSENKKGTGNPEGLVYFLKYNFSGIHKSYSNDPLDYAGIEKDKPVLVIREVIQRDIHGWYN